MNQKKNNVDFHHIQNRRYIGSKQKLVDWIFSIINDECYGDSFADLFAGTGIVAANAAEKYKKVIINDFLYSNRIIYEAFFSREAFDNKKITDFIAKYNVLPNDLNENYFSMNFGDKYFNLADARKIGYIREDIEKNRSKLSQKEYAILLTSLIYSTDKIANTVGHYDAFFKGKKKNTVLKMKPIEQIVVSDPQIYREDANLLARCIKSDITYIDPPYNSRQYSRFYHVLETLVKWDKPELFGVALKPEPENISDYCKNNAVDVFSRLINDLQSNFIVVSYNNTYKSKSNSSKNKISLEEIEAVLKNKGKTKIFQKKHQHFNAGNTKFNNHLEFLFVTEVKK